MGRAGAHTGKPVRQAGQRGAQALADKDHTQAARKQHAGGDQQDKALSRPYSLARSSEEEVSLGYRRSEGI